MSATQHTFTEADETAVRKLVAQHVKRQDEPLHLAILFAPKQRTQNISLFEVLGGFGGGQVDPKKELFQVSFGSTAGLPLPAGRSLLLTLTSPPELRAAVHDDWKSLRPIRDALAHERARVVHSDKLGKTLLSLLRGQR